MSGNTLSPEKNKENTSKKCFYLKMVKLLEDKEQKMFYSALSRVPVCFICGRSLKKEDITKEIEVAPKLHVLFDLECYVVFTEILKGLLKDIFEATPLEPFAATI